MDILFIILGFGLLVLGGDFLVRSSVGLSLKLNISKMVIGMTVVSFATSAPELLVSLQAALENSPEIAINNVIGSNIANLGLVLGVTAGIGAIKVSKDFYKLNWPVMVLFSILLYSFLQNDAVLTRLEGAILFIGLIVFLFCLIRTSKGQKENDEVDESLVDLSYFKIIFWLALGAVALYFGSEFLVDGAKNVARSYGVSEAVISVTLIAIGTSIPELAASVISVIKGEKSISLGNLLGSNIFNIGSVLGLTAIVKDIAVNDQLILDRDIFWMLAFAVILLPLVFLPKAYQISRIKGIFLFLGYSVFIYIVAFT